MSECKNLGNGRCLKDACGECISFKQEWSHVAGRVAAFGEIINLIEEKAGRAFVLNQDDEAQRLRSLARELNERVKGDRKTLDHCIKKFEDQFK